MNEGENLAVIIGPMVFEYSDNAEFLDALFELAKRPHTIFVPLYHGSNVRGALGTGCLWRAACPEGQIQGAGVSLADVIDETKTAQGDLPGGPGPVSGTAGLRLSDQPGHLLIRPFRWMPFSRPPVLPKAAAP